MKQGQGLGTGINQDPPSAPKWSIVGGQRWSANLRLRAFCCLFDLVGYAVHTWALESLNRGYIKAQVYTMGTWALRVSDVLDSAPPTCGTNHLGSSLK